MRQEIIAYQETEEHEVVNKPFLVIRERNFFCEIFKLENQVLSHHCNFDELKFCHSRKSRFVLGVAGPTFCRYVTNFAALVASRGFGRDEGFA